MATLNWFSGVSDPDAIRLRYRELAKKHHPDRPGGSVEAMQAINAEYDLVKDGNYSQNHTNYSYGPQYHQNPPWDDFLWGGGARRYKNKKTSRPQTRRRAAEKPPETKLYDEPAITPEEAADRVHFPRVIVEILRGDDYAEVWVTGRTFPAKEAIKAAGFRWSPWDKAWYWKTDWNQGKDKITLSERREKYEAETVWEG